MLIKDVEVKGFWGHTRANASFFTDVTIFIGLNGTGKTTFINLIAAVLTVDLFKLSSLQFEEIIINLIDKNNESITKITVSNTQEESSNSTFNVYNVYKYEIGSNIYEVSLTLDPRFKRRIPEKEVVSRYLPPEARRQYSELKDEISNLVEVSQISVNRQVSNESFEIEPHKRVTPVDELLKQLFERFARYQLKLETQMNERSRQFQQEALGSLLYNEEFDEFNSKRLEKVSDINLKDLEDKLKKAFKELGIQRNSEQISRHINKLRKAIQSIKSSKDNDSISVNDGLALPLFYRTNKIIDALNKSEEYKVKIAEPRQKFYATLQEFMTNKEFQYDKENSALSFSLKNINENEVFPWSSLSSGEKQLLIQFMEVLLQEGKSLIFIADEPELSLHVTWQEKLLKALSNLNENAQLIVATHSPDIVADFRDNLIHMEKVINTNA